MAWARVTKKTLTDYDSCPRPMAWARVKKKPYAYYDPCPRPMAWARVIKDLQLYVQVIIVTSNAVISSCCQRTEQTCSEVSIARAARLFVLTQSIKYLVCGVFTVVPAVEAVGHFYYLFFFFFFAQC